VFLANERLIYACVTSPPLFVVCVFLNCGNSSVEAFVIMVAPSWGTLIPVSNSNKVVFPLPFLPTKPIRSLLSICKCSISINKRPSTSYFKCVVSNKVIYLHPLFNVAAEKKTKMPPIHFQNRRHKCTTKKRYYSRLSTHERPNPILKNYSLWQGK